MNNKNTIKILIILGLLAILILISILIVIKMQKQRLDINEPINNNNNNNSNNKVIICKKKIKSDVAYETYNITEIEKENDIATKITFQIQIVYKDKDNYEGFKVNEKVTNPKYDDENLSIIYDLKEAIDLTKDENGNTVEKDYKTITENLKKDGYTCNE